MVLKTSSAIFRERPETAVPWLKCEKKLASGGREPQAVGLWLTRPRERGGRGAISWNIHEPAPSTPDCLELLSQVSKDVNDAQITLGFLLESDFVSGQVG